MSPDSAFQRAAADVIVGRNDFKVSERQSLCQGCYAVVKLMIANCAGVIANQGHGLVLNFTAIKIEVWRALADVARVDQKRVRVFLADAFDQSCATSEPAFARVGLVAFENPIDLRMGVVGVQNRD